MHVLQRGILLAYGNIAFAKKAACSESNKAGYEGTGEDAQRAQKLASIAGRRQSRKHTSRDLSMTQVLQDLSSMPTPMLYYVNVMLDSPICQAC